MSLRDLYQQYCDNPDLLDTTSSEALRIHEGSEGAALRHQAESYRHWAQLSIIADDEAVRLKDHVKEVVWSDCYLRAVQRLDEEGTKATEKRIEALARRDPQYQRSLESLRDAERRSSEFKSIEQAFWQRRDMLQSLNSRQCKELSSY